jgi:nitroreductase
MTSPLAGFVATATMAPSLHNSQPWRFRLAGDRIEVYADPARRLDALDPAGRQLMMSVGAALCTLRLAIRGAGRLPVTTTFPDGDRPDLVAVVRPGDAAEPTEEDRALVAAIGARHTNRRPFEPRVVPAEVVAELTAAARAEGAELVVADAAGRALIVALGRQAESLVHTRGGHLPEAMRPAGGPYRPLGPWEAMERTPMRDFGVAYPQPGWRGDDTDRYPTIVVLRTAGDGPADWLAAGQALQRVLLVATRHHLATTPISQPVEMPAFRAALAGEGRPQVVVRLGYAAPAAATGRRPLTDVLRPAPS